MTCQWSRLHIHLESADATLFCQQPTPPLSLSHSQEPARITRASGADWRCWCGCWDILGHVCCPGRCDGGPCGVQAEQQRGGDLSGLCWGGLRSAGAVLRVFCACRLDCVHQLCSSRRALHLQDALTEATDTSQGTRGGSPPQGRPDCEASGPATHGT